MRRFYRPLLSWWSARWRDSGRQWWRIPVAVTASVLLALFVYRLAERVRQPPPASPPARITALDAEALVALHELVRTVVPADEILPATNADEDAVLTALPWSGLLSASPPTAVPAAAPPWASDLSDAALQRIESLIGAPADA
jgi:hypothetical protein